MRRCQSFLLLSIVLFTGCGAGEKPKDLILGKWDGPFDNHFVDFKGDGTLVLEGPDILGSRIGKYKFLGADEIEVFTPAGSRLTYKVVMITKDELSLIEPWRIPEGFEPKQYYRPGMKPKAKTLSTAIKRL